jgi:anti-sigma regulatory factor (Ser/Thr protein kinase)
MIFGREQRSGGFDKTDCSVRMERTVVGPWVMRRRFLAAPEVVQEGRLIVESQALQWGLAEETVQDAVLVASELLTNAVRATRGRPVSLRLALTQDGLRVEVWDTSPVRPKGTAPDLSMPETPVPDEAPDPGGWGLGIVEFLSAEHGVRAQFEGKTVWALLKTRLRPSG